MLGDSILISKGHKKTPNHHHIHFGEVWIQFGVGKQLVRLYLLILGLFMAEFDFIFNIKVVDLEILFKMSSWNAQIRIV